MAQKKSLKTRGNVRAERNRRVARRKLKAAGLTTSSGTIAAMTEAMNTLKGTPREEIQHSINIHNTMTSEQTAKFAEALRRNAQPKATRFDTAGIDSERAHAAAEHTIEDCAHKFEQFREYNRADVREDKPTWGKFGSADRIHGYLSLEEVLCAAYQQASIGKGYDRHARGAAFDAQPTQIISGMLDTDAGLAFQAIKKVNEGMRLEHDAKIKEMLGAINYIASIVIYMEAKKNG